MLQFTDINAFSPRASTSHPPISAALSTASKPCSQTYAKEALARMKGCHVRIEGVDDCIVAYLMTLSHSEVAGLVEEWHHEYGFPTVSRLIGIKDAGALCALRNRTRATR